MDDITTGSGGGSPGTSGDGATDEPAPSASPDGHERDPLLLAVIGLIAATLLFLAAAIPVLRDRDADDAGSPTPGSPTAPPSSDPDTTTTPADTTAAAPPTSPAPSTSTTTSTTTVTTTTTSPPTTALDPGSGEIAESIAVVKGGKIYLSGAVPDEESMARIVRLAGAVLGEANVINDYIIDPRAGDPNLGNVRVDDTILFAPGTDRIAPEFEPLLNQALALMTIRPSVTMHVVGHTDDRGSVADNQDLSERRARAVVRWLTDRGVAPSRLTSEGRGELDPIATNETIEGQTRNRRIQVFIANLLSDDETA